MFRELIPKRWDSNRRKKKHESQRDFYSCEQTTSEIQTNGALSAWVLNKARKIDMTVLQKKLFDRQ